MAKRKKNPSGKTWLVVGGIALAALGYAGWAAAQKAKKTLKKKKLDKSTYTETVNGWKIEIEWGNIGGKGPVPISRYFAYVTPPDAERRQIGKPLGYQTRQEALDVARAFVESPEWDWWLPGVGEPSLAGATMTMGTSEDFHWRVYELAQPFVGGSPESICQKQPGHCTHVGAYRSSSGHGWTVSDRDFVYQWLDQEQAASQS